VTDHTLLMRPGDGESSAGIAVRYLDRRPDRDRFALRRSEARRGSAALAVLDKLNRGVLLLDGDGRVIFFNRAAERMLGQQAGIAMRRGRLVFEGMDCRRQYERFLAGGGASGSLVLRVAARSQAHDYRLLVSRLEAPGGEEPSGCYCVFVYEPATGPRVLAHELLRELYELTAAEARLANELFQGKSLVQAAQSLGVTHNTAKSTLKRVFAKCAVKSKSELVLLLSFGPRTL